MKSFNENYIQKQQVLSSLVVNVPYRVDGFNTAPKISKLLTFPFGIRINSFLLFKSTYRFILFVSMLMTITCVLVMCFYLPVQYQNNEMSKNARSLINKRFALLAKVQETSSYNKLFTTAVNCNLEDSKEVIRLQDNSQYIAKEPKSFSAFSKYPTIHFSGF